MKMEDVSMVIMNIIVDSGSARSYAMEAIALAKEQQYAAAEKALEQAGEAMAKAHQVQTELIQKEVRGEQTEVSLLMVHAQDHLMNGAVVLDLAKEFVALYKAVQ